jgi:chromate transporter
MDPTHELAPAAAIPERPAPTSRWDLFFSFTLLALQGFGGVMAVVQRDLVERKRWLTPEEFIEEWAVAQTLPGPNVINLALMLGARSFGLTGAIAAVAGLVLVPLVLVLVLGTVYSGFADVPAVRGAMRGMGAVAAGLIAATGLRLSSALRSNVMGLTACWILGLVAFAVVAVLRFPLAWMLLTVGPVASAWAWVCLGRRDTGREPAS